MLKTLLLAASLTACITASTDDDPELSTAEASIEAQPIPYCPDLENQKITTFEACFVLDGRRGSKECTHSCDFDREVVLDAPGSGVTCKIVSSTCGPKKCGPCEVLEWGGPLP